MTTKAKLLTLGAIALALVAGVAAFGLMAGRSHATAQSNTSILDVAQSNTSILDIAMSNTSILD